jgi:chaperone required for assembly of F1-ATPase
MSAWAPRRFWTRAEALAAEGGFTVRLDDRPVRTPAKTPLVVPTLALAQAIAEEWDAQDCVVRPDTMPFTRMANSALVKVPAQFDAVVDELAGYGATDLLCYRAEGPAALVQRQALAWDPLLEWARTELDAPLVVTAGVVPVPQPAHSLARLRAAVAAHDAFRLTGLHDLVAITGSLVLALAVARGRLSDEAAFALSRLDEHWQIEQWGADDDATATEALKRAALLQAGRFYRLSTV